MAVTNSFRLVALLTNIKVFTFRTVIFNSIKLIMTNITFLALFLDVGFLFDDSLQWSEKKL